MRQKLEAFFKKLSNEVKAESFTVEWRHHESLAQIQLKDDFYIFVIISWGDGDCTIEYMIGDENAVISQRHVELLEAAVSIIKKIQSEALREFSCLRPS